MSSPLPIDPYEVLGVARTADLSAIRSAHRKLALKYHPDRIKDEADRRKGTEEFQKAQQAYEILSDDKKRTTYDLKVKAAALKKEAMMNARTPGRSFSSYQTPQSAPTPRAPAAATTYDTRDDRIYEERRPRYSDDDDRYAEVPRTRKTAGYERKASSTYPEEKKKHSSEKTSSGFSSFMESKLRDKAKQARQRAAHSDAARTRDRERRRDSFDKYQQRRTAYVEDESSDSDGFIRRRPEAPSKKKTTYEEAPRKRKESPPPRKRESRRSARDESSSGDEWARRHRDATQYIHERSAPNRPGVLRSDSAQYYIPRERSSGRKSGSDRDDRREGRSRTKASSKPIEIVEPRRSPQSRKTAPPMPTMKSSPASLKTMMREAPQPQRSTTGEYPSDYKRPPISMSRSNTMPTPMSDRKETTSSRGSKLKHSETHDSGYGSSGPATPEQYGTSPPKGKQTRQIFIVTEDTENSRGGYRTVLADDYPSRRTRSPSPMRDREKSKDKDRKSRPERPTVQTTGSFSTTRSSPYTMSPDNMSARPSMFRTDTSRSGGLSRESPTLSRGESGRSGRLYGEIPKDDGYRYKANLDQVRYSPQLNSENIKNSVRRGSADVRDRDYYPGSHYDNVKTGRRESIY